MCVRKMPFFFSLFKITVLTKSGEPCLFTPIEIQNKLKYIFPYVDDNEWLTHAVPMSLQNDLSIFFCLSESYREYRLNDQRGKRAIGAPHDFGSVLDTLRKSFNYRILVKITKNGRIIANIRGKKQTGDIIEHEILLDDLRIRFLFEQMKVNIDDLKKNISVFAMNFVITIIIRC